MNEDRFKTAAGSFEIQRYPLRKSESLRGWNSADLLLVEHLLAKDLDPASILVVNDDHGALTVALRPAAVWSDSALAAIAIEANLQRNAMETIPVVASTNFPAGNFSIVAIKVPKVLSYFEYQLATLAASISPNTVVIAAGMDKHLTPRVAELLERYIGPTERYRGHMKARLFCAIRDKRPALETPAQASYHCEALGRDLRGMSNVFSREKMDIGSRFLIEQLHRLDAAAQLLDLACGNGILGLIAMKQGLCKNLAFCDESAMAVASAKWNADHLAGDFSGDIHYFQGDGLRGYDGPQADLILCNPPFHSNHTVEEYVGRRLLAQCATYLKDGGRLCMVANRHLQYLPTLKRGFSRVETLAQNNKFVILLAQK